jgi:4-amino-4-deoxy-L-arabinose transferase-like glycosyltransferase
MLVVLPALLLYPSLDFSLFDPDEGRYAEIPREMLLSGDFIVPTLQGEPYLDKPPLLYWLITGSYGLFGVHAWAARLVPALCLHATILIIYLLGRRSLGERVAFWGALVLALAPGFVTMGRLLLLDSLLTLWTTLALLSGFEAIRAPRLRWGWWLVAATAGGFGLLAKGPVILALVLPPLWLHRWLTSAHWRIGWRGWLGFAATVAAVTLPWYVAICQRMPNFARTFLWEHHLLRYLAPFAHEHGIAFYVPVLLLGLLPGTLLVWPVFRFLLSAREDILKRRSLELGFMVLAGGWCVLFFTLSLCKLPTYILPAFPFAALTFGYFLVESPWRVSRWPAGTAVLTALFLACAHHLVLPWFAAYRSPFRLEAELRRLCSDPNTPVVCYPRSCDSVAFYLGRSDVRSYRNKDIEDLRDLVRSSPRTVILCTHRHSRQALRELLPPEVKPVEVLHLGLPDLPGVPPSWNKKLIHLIGDTALCLADVVVVQPFFPAPENLAGRLPGQPIDHADVRRGETEDGEDD